jgi:hypothetical protein
MPWIDTGSSGISDRATHPKWREKYDEVAKKKNLHRKCE